MECSQTNYVNLIARSSIMILATYEGTKLRGPRNLGGVTCHPNSALCKRLEPYAVVQRFSCFCSQQVVQIGPPFTMITDGVFQDRPACAFTLVFTWGCHRPNSNGCAGARRRNAANG